MSILRHWFSNERCGGGGGGRPEPPSSLPELSYSVKVRITVSARPTILHIFKQRRLSTRD